MASNSPFKANVWLLTLWTLVSGLDCKHSHRTHEDWKQCQEKKVKKVTVHDEASSIDDVHHQKSTLEHPCPFLSFSSLLACLDLAGSHLHLPLDVAERQPKRR